MKLVSAYSVIGALLAMALSTSCLLQSARGATIDEQRLLNDAESLAAAANKENQVG